jgi:hypothetical protein
MRHTKLLLGRDNDPLLGGVLYAKGTNMPISTVFICMFTAEAFLV